jgi:hypothetical protein
MKNPDLRSLSIIPLLAATLSLDSCIYEAPGDNFYRTMWSSSEVPLGSIDVKELTLEFLCGNKVTIKNEDGIIIAYGNYYPDGRTVVFTDVTTIIDDISITFHEAHLNGDVLFLLWRPDDMLYPYTTALTRKLPPE